MILSVYTDFFAIKTWQNTDFSLKCQRDFFYVFFIHTDYFPQIQIFCKITVAGLYICMCP